MSYHYTVTPQDTARAQGSGGLEVLSTPRLIAFMENAAYLNLQDQLEVGYSSVGGRISCQHLAPSQVGKTITVHLTSSKQDGKKVEYELEAYDGDFLIARAQHLRIIIKTDTFMGQLNQRDK